MQNVNTFRWKAEPAMWRLHLKVPPDLVLLRSCKSLKIANV